MTLHALMTGTLSQHNLCMFKTFLFAYTNYTPDLVYILVNLTKT